MKFHALPEALLTLVVTLLLCPSLVRGDVEFTAPVALTGSTPPQYLNAVRALSGSTNGPSSVGYSPSSFSASAPMTASSIVSTYPSTSVQVTTSNGAATTATTTSSPVGGGSHKDGSGISAGALFGIAIAGAVIGLLGIGLALFACLRWRKQKDPGIALPDKNSTASTDHLRREMSFADSAQTPVELDPYTTIVEAGDGMQRAEMDAMNVRAELPGDMSYGHGPYGHYFEPPLTSVPSTPIENLTLDNQTCLALRAVPKEQV